MRYPIEEVVAVAMLIYLCRRYDREMVGLRFMLLRRFSEGIVPTAISMYVGTN
jgi:hypothetical protein